MLGDLGEVSRHLQESFSSFLKWDGKLPPPEPGEEQITDPYKAFSTVLGAG